MAVASPTSPVTARPSPLKGTAKQAPVSDAEWWVEPIRWIALAVFIAIPIFSLLAEDYAGGGVWTVVIAGLPVFIVLVGYHRWRRICPLAFFAQLPVRLKRPGTRRAGPWLEANYYYIAFAVFFVSLWLRLIATNGDGHAIAAFFVLVSLAALLFGLLYTGKTWCNYICPLSFIEKIYTEPHGLRETRNSQCAKCTACKKSCPDINEENGYWKDIDSRPKRFAYYAFPGLVFGFYFYFYVQSGSWHYYFSGAWTRQPDLVYTAFLPGYDAPTAGFFFLRVMPRAVAAVVTLALGGLASFWVFSRLERLVGPWLRRRYPEMDVLRVRHVIFTLAAFAAFTTFYSFAGAPTLRLFPPFQHLFLITVVLTATLFLTRRFRRTQQVFAEETLARNMIKHWEWSDIQPPKDLHEAFLIHTIRSRESKKGSAQVLEVYKNAVRETLANGFVTRAEVHLLESLRDQLRIKKADHDKVMAELAEEERELLGDPARQVSVEKRLQLDTYARALESYLQRVFAAESTPDDSFIMQLRSEYQVTKEEHEAVLDELVGGAGAMAKRLVEAVSAFARATHTIQALEREPSPARDFLRDLVRRRRDRAIEGLMYGLSLTADADTIRIIREGLSARDRALREAAIEQVRASVAPSIAERMFATYRETAINEAKLATMADILRARTLSVDPYIRATALHLLGESGAVDEGTLDRLCQDEHEVVREVALQVRERTARGASEPGRGPPLTTLEKMIALRSAAIFSPLAPESLAALARASIEEEYRPGEALCVEGEAGNEVFILLQGEATILRSNGANGKVINTEKAGGLIGEMAILAPAPRSATVRAGANGTRVLRLDGNAFRDALNTHPAIASEVIRTLADRLRSLEQTMAGNVSMATRA
jgi:Cyclic nucleotide-binding domain